MRVSYIMHKNVVFVFPGQVLVVRFASLFDVKERTVTFLSGKKYSVETLCSMGAGDLLNSMLDFSEKLRALNLSEEEMSLFTAVVLVSAGTIYIHVCHFLSQSAQQIIHACIYTHTSFSLLGKWHFYSSTV